MSPLSAEASACVSAALRVALGHPEISVRFLKDGEEEAKVFIYGDPTATGTAGASCR